ncbi:regulated potassium-efflux system protein [Seminavis robusta]|uniref:Regulated potassium-efflux system protein n=1 Tax=Seminavis robusta TaxID=568900 RepID=A0A9N8HRP0_9STRA|nr:regulated potassium-efflux system protein [Seminavis robusta]|eukprot:Sro1293_g260140.1 regulated potassium-efflux system protein (872) ;mRNA; r:20738-23440
MGFHSPTAFVSYPNAVSNYHRIPQMPMPLGRLPPTSLQLSPLSDFSPAIIHSLWDTTTHLADAIAAPMSGDHGSLMNSVSNEIQNMMTESEHVEIPKEMEMESLEFLGHDLLLFLAVAVLVDPLAKIMGVTPVLLYLVLGFVAGPYGLSLFLSGTEVNSEIGDFGILFLLFVEGLQLSPERLKALGGFFSLGIAQLLLSVGGIFFLFFFGGPYLLPIVQDLKVPIDSQTLQLLEKPVIAFSIAAAGALSSSAFVLPILKEKGWEKRADGIAALSILLLQDLAVAPLLVALPLIAEYESNGGSIQDPTAVGILAAKATIGFGSVLVLASVILRQIFQVVASYGSSQTFVAASLLVAVGMGVIADDLGLSSTTGAFAAGVILAESGYRAQIEADIKPFEGILLGVFFVTAGASLDPMTCIEQWPTLLAGIATFIGIKLAIIFAAGEFALGLTRADSARVALLLAGGGEFAFVVFKLAEDLGGLPPDLAKLLTASVVISMSLTPILGMVAQAVGDKLDELEGEASIPKLNGVNGETKDYDVNLNDEEMIREAFETFDEDGNGAICADELQLVLTKPGTNTMLSKEEVEAVIARFDDNGDGMLQFDEFAALWTAKRRGGIIEVNKSVEASKKTQSLSNAVVVCGYGQVGQKLCAALDEANKAGIGGGVPYVAFSQHPERISLGVLNGASVVYGNGASPSLIRASGVKKPSAFAVVYKSEGRCLEATIRLREAFPTVPIYVRTGRFESAKRLSEAGATDVIVETEKVAEALRTLVSRYGDTSVALMKDALLANELKELYDVFSTSLDKNENGEVKLAELRDELMRQRDQPLDDKSLAEWMGYEEALSKWVTGDAESRWVTFPEFVRFSVRKLEPHD